MWMQSASSRIKLVSRCPFPATITMTPRAPPQSIVVIVYYFYTWDNKEHVIINSRVIRSHMGPMYTVTPFSSSSCRAASTDTLTVSRHFSLSFIAFGRSSGYILLSSHSCCMYVRAGRSAFCRPYVEVHRSTSLMSSSLLLQQCPACLVRLTWMFRDGK